MQFHISMSKDSPKRRVFCLFIWQYMRTNKHLNWNEHTRGILKRLCVWLMFTDTITLISYTCVRFIYFTSIHLLLLFFSLFGCCCCLSLYLFVSISFFAFRFFFVLLPRNRWWISNNKKMQLNAKWWSSSHFIFSHYHLKQL